MDHTKDHKEALELKIEGLSDHIVVTAQEISGIRGKVLNIRQELDVTTLTTKKKNDDGVPQLGFDFLTKANREKRKVLINRETKPLVGEKVGEIGGAARKRLGEREVTFSMSRPIGAAL